MDVKPDLEALAAADPYAVGTQEKWRQRLMARDRKGYLRQAEDAATQAVALARPADERYQAILWLALIECDRGRHAAELRSARRLMALRPHDPTSLGTLRRAAKCNGLQRLERAADGMLDGVTGGSEPP
jgi:hypothetical protein